MTEKSLNKYTVDCDKTRSQNYFSTTRLTIYKFKATWICIESAHKLSDSFFKQTNSLESNVTASQADWQSGSREIDAPNKVY